MNKEKTAKFHISMRTFLRFTILLLVLFAMASVAVGIIYLDGKNASESLLDQTEDTAERLADRIALQHFKLISSQNTLDSDLDETAFLAGGRILVINRDYRIEKDTFVFQQNAYIISENVMNVMTQKKEKLTWIRNGYAEVILPVTDEGGQVLGVIVSTASTRAIERRHDKMIQNTLILCGCLFLVLIVFAWLISHFTVRGLVDMNKRIAVISEGDLSVKLPEKGFRETRYLAKNYNEAISRLEDIDISRQEFVSDVSHELKTPITSMKVLAESLLQNQQATASDYQEFMTDIVDEIDRETKIINDLLALVKTDKKNVVMNFSMVNINQQIDVIMRRVTPLAQARGIELTYESFREVIAEVDEVKLSLVISNLVENAIKYNVDNGWVRITLNADNKYFYIKVADSGVGIPDDEKDKVFDRFYRVNKDRSRETGGTGLGLAIARGAINAHGGVLKLYSESGKGTTFTVRIPLRQEEHAAEAAAEMEKEERS
ncbi:MAG: HAMP domain-containing histidine kinase [Eubacterium sp.]|nr:HAMP domain-containing histidine kinase [Eubacterium sp.]